MALGLLLGRNRPDLTSTGGETTFSGNPAPGQGVSRIRRHRAPPSSRGAVLPTLSKSGVRIRIGILLKRTPHRAIRRAKLPGDPAKTHALRPQICDFAQIARLRLFSERERHSQLDALGDSVARKFREDHQPGLALK